MTAAAKPPRGRRRSVPPTPPVAKVRVPDAVLDDVPGDHDVDDDGLYAPDSSPYINGAPEAPRQRAPRMFDRSSGENTVEIRDALRDHPRRREELAKRAYLQKMRANNPFLVDDGTKLPKAPPDDETYAYKWMRITQAGQPDASHIARSTTGKLAWEFVRIDQLPLAERKRLQVLSQVEGKYSGCIVVNDLALVRTDRVMRDLRKEANIINARHQIGGVRGQELQADLARVGIRGGIERESGMSMGYVDPYRQNDSE